jgi:LytS/YehU family sensor histidine kinase
MVGSYGISEEWKGKVSVEFTGSLTEKAFHQRKSLRIVNITEDPSYGSTHLAQQCGFTSIMVIPFIIKNKLIGEVTLYIGNNKSLDLFENEFIEKYTNLIALILATLENRS